MYDEFMHVKTLFSSSYTDGINCNWPETTLKMQTIISDYSSSAVTFLFVGFAQIILLVSV